MKKKLQNKIDYNNYIINLIITMLVIIEEGSKADKFAAIFRYLKINIQEVNLIFEDERLYIQGMDSSHIGLFELVLKKNWFEKYEVVGGATLGINCEIFHKMLNCLDKKQKISLEFDKECDNLDIAFQSDEKGIINKHFELPLLDIYAQLLGIPPVDYTVDLQLRGSVFEKIIEQLSIFADTVKISCSEEKVSLKTTKESSLLIGQMEARIGFEDMTEYLIEEEETISLAFSLKYLNWMVQFSQLSEIMNIHLIEDLPLKIKYNLEGDSYIQFFLAPQQDDF